MHNSNRGKKVAQKCGLHKFLIYKKIFQKKSIAQWAIILPIWSHWSPRSTFTESCRATRVEKNVAVSKINYTRICYCNFWSHL
jgi:hypothetical protein